MEPLSPANEINEEAEIQLLQTPRQPGDSAELNVLFSGSVDTLQEEEEAGVNCTFILGEY